ncbi:MAG: glycogen/starch synthase, partial [Candidatus Aminicenantales bacterium]
MKFLAKKRTRVIQISAEPYPFSNDGGGASAVRVLPESLSRLGYEVSLITPKYRRPAIEGLALSPMLPRFPVPLGSDKVLASVWKAEAVVSPALPDDAPSDPEPPARRFPVYFIENVKYFGRERIFGSENTPYPDNDERFAFFCRAALEFLRKARIGVDILHCHDWPAALVPLLLRTQYPGRNPFGKTASVLTVHDPAAQGEFPPEALALTGLSWDFFTPDRLALNGKFNFIKAGFLFADAVNAGDGAAAEAVRTGAAGADLAAILERRQRETAKDSDR